MNKGKLFLLMCGLVTLSSATGCASKDINPYQVQKPSSTQVANKLTDLNLDEALIAGRYVTDGNNTVTSISECVNNITSNFNNESVIKSEAIRIKTLAVLGCDIFYMKDDIPNILEGYVSCFVEIMNESITFSEELQKGNQSNYIESAKKITELINELTDIVNGLSQ